MAARYVLQEVKATYIGSWLVKKFLEKGTDHATLRRVRTLGISPFQELMFHPCTKARIGLCCSGVWIGGLGVCLSISVWCFGPKSDWAPLFSWAVVVPGVPSVFDGDDGGGFAWFHPVLGLGLGLDWADVIPVFCWAFTCFGAAPPCRFALFFVFQ